MGNCCSGDDSKRENETEAAIEYDPADTRASTSSRSNTPFMGTPDVTMGMESEMEKSFLLQKELAGDRQSKTSQRMNGKKPLLLNPRLVPLLEFFSHLYLRKKDLFTRVISVHGEELVEMFKKVERVEESIERPRIKLMQRSRSLGSGEDLKNQRMKIKTFKPDEGQPAGTSSGGTKPGNT